jgi:hypothetical protein
MLECIEEWSNENATKVAGFSVFYASQHCSDDKNEFIVR